MKITFAFFFLSIIIAAQSALAFGNVLEKFVKPVSMAGQYILVKASTEYAKQNNCDSHIEITIGNDEVRLEGLSAEASMTFEVFKFADNGCRESICTYFTEDFFGMTARLHLSFAGAARKAKMIRRGYFDKDTLYYSHDHTQVPLGIFGFGKEQTFSCQYRRVK